MSTLIAPARPFSGPHDKVGSSTQVRRVALADVASVEVAPRRVRAKRGDGDRLRVEILDATDQLLVEGGTTESVSIRAVAERVGCTPPAIYLHFFDKQELLFDVCARRFAELGQWVDEAIVGIDDPVAALEAGARAYVRFGLAYPEHYRILFMGRSLLTGDQLDELRRTGITGLGRLVERCRTCIDGGFVTPAEPNVMAYAMWSMAHGIVSLMITKTHVDWPDVEVLMDHLLGSYVKGIRA
jgi:AcrR family transcriptional regulator